MPSDRNPDPQDEEDVSDLPNREALSLITDPTSLIGGLGGTTGGTPTASPTDATQTPGSGIVPTVPSVNVPHLPVPETNPGGTYTPDASATSETP